MTHHVLYLKSFHCNVCLFIGLVFLFYFISFFSVALLNKYLPEFLLNLNFWLTPFVPIQQHIDCPQMHVLIQAIVLVQTRYEYVLVYGMVAKGNQLHKEKTENNKIKFHFHNFD